MAEGYQMFDCPNCTKNFLVESDNYESKHRLSCPYCGHNEVRYKNTDGKLLR